MVAVMKIMVTSFKRSCAHTASFNAPNLAAGHHRPTPPLETPGHSWASLDQSLVGSLLLSPASWHTQGFVCILHSLFPQSCVSSVIKSHWPPKSNSLGISVPLPDPQVGKSAMGSRPFLTVQTFLWYNCSVVCGSSAQWLYGGVNGNLLQGGLCHT